MEQVFEPQVIHALHEQSTPNSSPEAQYNMQYWNDNIGTSGSVSFVSHSQSQLHYTMSGVMVHMSGICSLYYQIGVLSIFD